MLDNPGRNVLTGCGEHGKVATLRLRIPPKQEDGNAWDGANFVFIQATGARGYFEFRNRKGSHRTWTPFTSEGKAFFGNNTEGYHTMEVRVRSGQNISLSDGIEMFLTLKKTADSPQSDKYRVYNPVIQIRAFGGRGCQTRVNKPTCRGFWDWTGGMPRCLLE